ncbi:MAG: ATP-binding protein [Candidatus Acidiferrales bacterium]
MILPRLFAQVQDLARRTAAMGRREEQVVEVEVVVMPRFFSICAIPLEASGEVGPAVCLMARDITLKKQAQKALAEREALLERAEEVANFGSWEMDLKTNQITLSPQMMKMYEIDSKGDWSEELFWQRMHPSDRERTRRFCEKSMLEGKPFAFAARYCAPDGRVRVHLAHTLPLQGKDGKPDRAIGVIQDVTEQARSQQDLRRLSQQLMNEQDSQRRHLARELHESAGQSLAALKMTLGRLREALPEDAELAASLLQSAVLLADGAVREVRTVSYLLHPPLLDDAGLGPALRWYAKGFSERSGIRATVHIADPFGRYSQEIETTVFRVVQEALTNVHRYSGSPFAEIRVKQKDSQLRVEICDRGCGLASPAEAARRHAVLGVGISGMRERVQQVDGSFELDSVPGEGTTVRVLLPARPLKPLRKTAAEREPLPVDPFHAGKEATCVRNKITLTKASTIRP